MTYSINCPRVQIKRNRLKWWEKRWGIEKWKNFHLKWNQRPWNGESHACTLRRMELRTERLIAHKRLIYWRLRIISWVMNICWKSLPILKPMNLLLGLWLDFLLFALLAHNKNPPQTPNWLVWSLSQHVFPKLLFPNKLDVW